MMHKVRSTTQVGCTILDRFCPYIPATVDFSLTRDTAVLLQAFVEGNCSSGDNSTIRPTGCCAEVRPVGRWVGVRRPTPAWTGKSRGFVGTSLKLHD